MCHAVGLGLPFEDTGRLLLEGVAGLHRPGLLLLLRCRAGAEHAWWEVCLRRHLPHSLQLLPLLQQLGGIGEAAGLAAWHGAAQRGKPAARQRAVALLRGCVAVQAAGALQRCPAGVLLLRRLLHSGMLLRAGPVRLLQGSARWRRWRRPCSVCRRCQAIRASCCRAGRAALLGTSAGRACRQRARAAGAARVLSPFPLIAIPAAPAAADSKAASVNDRGSAETCCSHGRRSQLRTT